MALERELKHYEEHRAEWLEQGREGDWVAIRGEDVLGIYPSLREAYQAAVKAYGADAQFLVKEIVEPEEEIETVQRVHWGTETLGSTKVS